MLPGQMLPGQMFSVQMSSWQLTSVKDGSRKLIMKFGQNQVSNSWDIADMGKCRQDKCYMDNCLSDNCLSLLTVSG